ncbi:MAG TPA: hypothetical protein VFR78_22465 [Pyrinomonadaceae bacterium]|nr:hypothetical protein [Pyrinomonadaceae bacterium]
MCLLIRNVIGLVFSMLSLLWAGAVYILWYRGTLSIIGQAEVTSFRQLGYQAQYLLPLHGATWWNVAVL